MATAKSMFERSSGNVSPQTARKSSKWDKPKDAPPPPVNREGDDDSNTNVVDPELPPPSYTKSMLAKFQTIQQNEDQVKEANVTDTEREKVSSQLNATFFCQFPCTKCLYQTLIAMFPMSSLHRM